MKKPTPAEVETYALGIGFKIDGERFVDYYTSIGWVVGPKRKQMVNWQAAVRTWKRNQEEIEKGKASVPAKSSFVPPSVRFAPPPEEERLTWEDIQQSKK